MAASLGDASTARQFAFLTLSGVGAGAFADDRANSMAAADSSTGAATAALAPTSNLTSERCKGGEIEHSPISEPASGSVTSTTHRTEAGAGAGADEEVSEAVEGGSASAAGALSSSDSSAVAEVVKEIHTKGQGTPADIALSRAMLMARHVLVDVAQCGPELGAAAFDASLCSTNQNKRKIKAALNNLVKAAVKVKNGASIAGVAGAQAGMTQRNEQLLRGGGSGEVQFPSPPSSSSTSLGLGLLHAAAVMGDSEAQLALAHRYQVVETELLTSVCCNDLRSPLFSGYNYAKAKRYPLFCTLFFCLHQLSLLVLERANAFTSTNDDMLELYFY